MFKFNIRNFVVGLLFSLVTVTIISIMLSQFTSLETLETGKAFLIVFVAILISVIYLAAQDKKIERGEVWTLLFVTLLLGGSLYAMYKFIPEIFSILPKSAQDVFSVIGG